MLNYRINFNLVFIALILLVSFGAMGGCNGEDGGGNVLGGEPGSRTLTFTNMCPFPVWIGVNGGRDGGLGQCNEEMKCPPGQACNTGNNECFWSLPKPMTGNFKLEEGGMDGDQAIFNIPASQASNNVLFQGVFYGSIFCESNGDCMSEPCGVNCLSPQCAGGSCGPGVGPVGPFTRVEPSITLTRDNYNLSVINGFNIPISVVPEVNAKANTNPYICASLGTTSNKDPLSGCDWKFDTNIEIHGMTTDFSTSLRYVAAGGISCTEDKDCNAEMSEFCGISISNSDPKNLERTCGRHVGWWIANQVCVRDMEFGDPFNCMEMSGSKTLFELYECSQSPLFSCYDPAQMSNPNCCGCPNWTQIGIPAPLPPGVKCENTNQSWTDNVLPWVEFFKKACPTIFTFPFDDKTSDVSCRPDETENGLLPNYTITYCPGEKTGLSNL